MRETPAGVGAALARAMRRIERANPDTLARVFGAADWGNRELLGDALLKDLIEKLSGVPLGNRAVASDVLGDAYEYLIEAVVGLAPNVFYGTGLAPAVVTLRRAKGRGRRGRVIVVDASSLFRKGRAQNFLDPEHAERIVGWVRRFRDVADRAKVVSTEEIAAEDWTLNVSRYVPPPVGAGVPPLPEAVAAFKQALAEARAAEDRLRRVLADDGWLE